MLHQCHKQDRELHSSIEKWEIPFFLHNVHKWMLICMSAGNSKYVN
jgi:hypothetical protein